jgi:uncharacterized protein (TIGR02145 family)
MMSKVYRASKSLMIMFFLALLSGACNKKIVDPQNSVRDIDGNLYKTVKIGDQEWMAENLRVTRYRNGRAIPLLTSNVEWGAQNDGLCSDYNFLADSARGRLYNWNAVSEYKDHILAPVGWHIPTQEEYQKLVTFLGGENIAGGKMKDTLYWSPMYTPKKLVCGFNAVPAGYRDYYGIFRDRDAIAYFWTSSQMTGWSSISLIIFEGSDNVQLYEAGKTEGFSIRCVRD